MYSSAPNFYRLFLPGSLISAAYRPQGLFLTPLKCTSFTVPPLTPQNPTVSDAMALRIASRFVSRRFSSSGKVLSEEEKAAENVYIKKIEQEKLEKLARKGPKPEEPTTSSGGSVTETKPSGGTSSTAGVSTDKYRNYAVLAGVVTALGALGWYLKGSSKKPEEVQD